jgi:hypothetical protein
MMKRWVTISHDDKKTVTGRSRDGHGTVTVTGQNHNFYSNLSSIKNYLDRGVVQRVVVGIKTEYFFIDF